MQADRVFKTFRARFIGTVSPVHVFWCAGPGVTRFSGRRAPAHPGAPAFSDGDSRSVFAEVSSCGFWPGGGAIAYPAFYSYAYPEPTGFTKARVQPGAAFYSNDLHEFILPYDVARQAKSPDDTLLEFLQTTYEAAANLAKWDRASLERGDSKIADGATRET